MVRYKEKRTTLLVPFRHDYSILPFKSIFIIYEILNSQVVTKRSSPPASMISELELMHRETMNKIEEYNDSSILPSGT